MSNTTTRTPNFCPYCERRTGLAHKPSCPTQLLAQLQEELDATLMEIKSELAAGDHGAAAGHADNLADGLSFLAAVRQHKPPALIAWLSELEAISTSCMEGDATDAMQRTDDLRVALGEFAA